MYKVKQWRDIGVEFVDGDQISGEPVTRKGAEAVNKGGFSGNREATGFTPRKNTGTQPVPNEVMVVVELKDGTLMNPKKAKDIMWWLKLSGFSESRSVIKWTPSLTQPLIDKQKGSEMSELEIHKAWVALGGDLNNVIDDVGSEKNHLLVNASAVGDFKIGDYAFSVEKVYNKSVWGYVCTIQEFTDYCEMMKEKRMDIIGQNGNDGLHYDNTAQQFESLAIDSKPVFTQAMADRGELPPVGCEYLDEDGQLCICIGYSVGKGFVVGQMTEHPSSNGYPPISKSEKSCVKPIKSPREKAIEEMVNVFAGNDDEMPIDEMCEEIYKAGYRKLTPEHAKMYDDKSQFFGEDYK